MTPINSWPVQERPREKLLAKGPQALSDGELLAIFLRTGVKGKSALDLAREMIEHFGGLKNLLSADFNNFVSFKGIGKAKYAQLQACMEMGQRYLAEEITRGNVFNNPGQVKKYIQSHLSQRDNEVFAVLFMDNQHRMIIFEELFSGTINYSHVYPRVIIQRVIKLNAAAIILAHNHPSGHVEISRSDIEITQSLKTLLEAIDVRLLDHLVVASTEVISMAEKGHF